MGLSQSKPFNKSTRSLLKITQERRTHYKLLGKSPISDNEIETLVQNATKYVPTAWNTQSSRVILLLNDEHKKVWDIALSVIEGLVKAGGIPRDMFENYTKPKLEAFKAAYGTVLLFVDYESLAATKEKFAIYADKVDTFALEANAMAEYLIWISLQSEGLGANLQHYNPLIDDQVAKTWDIPSSWKLEGQIVFGTPAEKVEEKEFDPIESRFKVYGKN
ncbi:uncharacterized protein N7469_001599 [Penicillium citrinum]|uniref:Nitroreductase domain-containing protein n=2 Tax=Penicillium TaxID=5073 RepID=A0A9W9PET7_PENCI|nr:uncharacterized protein N7469_001599 [Penicillium citrinum]KAJ5243272.1 hypothetical protein N7469_001599 [Penicillium citrinum]KAJ5599224.1 hypothetical protein N7450_000291 [Penicillium hetheringtonii]